jgi:competence protein ComEA
VPPAAGAAAAVLALVVLLLAWSRSGGGAVREVPARPVPERSRSLTAAAGSTPTPTATPGVVVVDVEGRVRHPGLQRLPSGSRVADAVRAAGGVGAGAVLARLNVARLLVDGEQIVVPGPDDPVPAAGGADGAGPPPGSASAGPLDLNSATQEGLDALPGVGPVLAARILAWRTAHGRFTSVDELGEVPGIGPKALERLRPLVRV